MHAPHGESCKNVQILSQPQTKTWSQLLYAIFLCRTLKIYIEILIPPFYGQTVKNTRTTLQEWIYSSVEAVATAIPWKSKTKLYYRSVSVR